MGLVFSVFVIAVAIKRGTPCVVTLPSAVEIKTRTNGALPRGLKSSPTTVKGFPTKVILVVYPERVAIGIELLLRLERRKFVEVRLEE